MSIFIKNMNTGFSSHIRDNAQKDVFMGNFFRQFYANRWTALLQFFYFQSRSRYLDWLKFKPFPEFFVDNAKLIILQKVCRFQPVTDVNSIAFSWPMEYVGNLHAGHFKQAFKQFNAKFKNSSFGDRRINIHGYFPGIGGKGKIKIKGKKFNPGACCNKWGKGMPAGIGGALPYGGMLRGDYKI